MKSKGLIAIIVLIATVLAIAVYGFPGAGRYVPTILNSFNRFLFGVLDGAISIISLIVSFFNKCINIYDIRIASTAYNIGYILGVWLLFGGVLSLKTDD
jgi:hypothetical protein